MINVLIGGDVCPIGKNMPYFEKGDAGGIFNDLLDEFHEADLSIVNLECPLVGRSSPAQKNGPSLRAPTGCVAGIKQAKIDIVNLSNNHIMDHGANGLFSTLGICNDAGIDTVGAGKNIMEARKILVKNVSELRVGFLGLSEREFSIATYRSCGANSLDIVDCCRNIRSNKGNFDYLIVLVHGGNISYQFPSPRLKKVCHFLVEMGANAVIVQHTHCPGCYEKYKNSFIIYGQGNLIFDSIGHDRTFYEGFLVKLLISKDLNAKIELIPFSQSLSQVGARRLVEKRSGELLEELKQRSLAIADDIFVRDEWLKFCKKRKAAYLSRIYGFNLLFKKMIYRNLFVKFFMNRNSLYRLENTISCESHREVIETLLENNMI